MTESELQARKDVIRSLYIRLTGGLFECVPDGEHRLQEIYRLVKAAHPELCDDGFVCRDNCKTDQGYPEWHHTVRTALQNLKTHRDGLVKRGGRHGAWVFALARRPAGKLESIG